MIEYPSIIPSSKAPRKECIIFDKIDGSNFRAKWTSKRGFDLFGTRTQIIDETNPVWGQMVTLFKAYSQSDLDQFFRSSKRYRDYREIICFFEFYGEGSFAGTHTNSPKILFLFDVLCGHKDRKFVLPQDFIKDFSFVQTPAVLGRRVLSDEFIEEVRSSESLNEGVICKGVERSGAFRGGIWMTKIKTRNYFDRLKSRFGSDWERYAE